VLVLVAQRRPRVVVSAIGCSRRRCRSSGRALGKERERERTIKALSTGGRAFLRGPLGEGREGGGVFSRHRPAVQQDVPCGACSSRALTSVGGRWVERGRLRRCLGGRGERESVNKRDRRGKRSRCECGCCQRLLGRGRGAWRGREGDRQGWPRTELELGASRGRGRVCSPRGDKRRRCRCSRRRRSCPSAAAGSVDVFVGGGRRTAAFGGVLLRMLSERSLGGQAGQRAGFTGIDDTQQGRVRGGFVSCPRGPTLSRRLLSIRRVPSMCRDSSMCGMRA
jgi:hypothetical protein